MCVGSKSEMKDSVFALSCIIESQSNLGGININPFLWHGALWSLRENRETHTGRNMPRSSSSKTFSITGKVSKRCFVGFDFKALDMQSLGSMGGRCGEVELHTILQIWSIVRLHIGLFYNSVLHDRETCIPAL